MSKVSKKWLKLFNQVTNNTQLDMFLTSISGESLTEWENRYRNYEQVGKYNTTRELSEIQWELYEPQDNLRYNIHWLDLFKPICLKYLEKLSIFLNNTISIQDKKQFFIEIESTFFEICMNISYRTVILEINNLRRSSRLIGKDSKERYDYFINTLLQNRKYILEFYNKYPVLYELLDKKLSNTFKYVKLIITQFENSKLSIESYFNLSNLVVSKIHFNVGDTHSDGKSVCILEFDNGRKLVYKPRNMSVDVNLDLFAKEFSATFDLPNVLFIPRTFSKDSYSFVEFIQEKECNSIQDVKTYYNNMGKLLAFLHIFGAKDYHGENILAHQSAPYLIDNETILHFNENEIITSNIQNIYDYVANSVYSVGILPMTLYSINNDKGMEVGALNSGERRESPYLTHQLANVGTDEIRIEKVFKEVGDFPSTVRYKGKTVSCSEYRECVHQGFETIYKIILNNKDKVIEMITKYFKDCETRYIYRNTNIYVQFLETSHHPDLLKNKYDFEMYLLRLFEYGDVEIEFDRIMIEDEISQLRKGDIPIFYTNSSQNKVYNGIHSHLFSLDGSSILEKVLSRVSNLSEKNLLRQKRIINMTFMGSELFLKNREESNEKSLNLKSSFIDHIMSARFEFDGESSWLSMLAMNKNYDISPMDYSLYNETSGMILGISSIKDDRLQSILPGVLKYTNNYVQNYCQGEFLPHKLGAFTGIYGYLYTLCTLKQKGIDLIENQEELIKKILLSTYDSIQKLDNLDIIGGLSGILAVLIKIKEVTSNYSDISNLADTMAKDIVKRLIITYREKGYWVENDPGYAHGDYGVIAQLFKYSKLLDERSKLKKTIVFCIQEYLENERSQLGREKVIPLRENAKYYSWCNGVVGIVKVKQYLLLNGFPDPYLEKEVEYYSKEVLSHQLNFENSICHGNVGNLVIVASILGESNTLVEKIASESSSYFFDKIAFECDDWGVLTGELGILMANYESGRKMLNEILLLN